MPAGHEARVGRAAVSLRIGSVADRPRGALAASVHHEMRVARCRPDDLLVRQAPAASVADVLDDRRTSVGPAGRMQPAADRATHRSRGTSRPTCRSRRGRCPPVRRSRRAGASGHPPTCPPRRRRDRRAPRAPGGMRGAGRAAGPYTASSVSLVPADVRGWRLHTSCVARASARTYRTAVLVRKCRRTARSTTGPTSSIVGTKRQIVR